jgi:ubiquinone/menaquinone biosynthesis C-methylase UbiE
MTEPKSSPTLLSRFMRLFFRLLYHPLAWTYDLVAASVSLGRWKQWVLTSTDLLQGPSVLELGFGPGHLQTHLHGQALRVTGLDESFQMSRQASRRLIRRNYLPRLVRGLAQNLPYAAGTFDSVVSTFPTPYIYDPHSLAEIGRVLKPGGRLVILMAAWITGKSLADRFMADLFRTTNQAPPEDSDFQQLLAVFHQSGFEAQTHYLDLTDHSGQPSSRLMFIIAEQQQDA